MAYLGGLVSPSEMVPAARQQRDRMLARLVVPALQATVDAFSMTQPRALQHAMQQVANVWSLAQGLPALDDFTVAHARYPPSPLPTSPPLPCPAQATIPNRLIPALTTPALPRSNRELPPVSAAPAFRLAPQTILTCSLFAGYARSVSLLRF